MTEMTNRPRSQITPEEEKHEHKKVQASSYQPILPVGRPSENTAENPDNEE
jgi:hypothetical protein